MASIDPDALSLEEAREALRDALRRLAVYEGFDSLIVDNVRRAKEMMTAAAEQRALLRDRARAERMRIDGELSAFQRDLARISTDVAAMTNHLSVLRAMLDASPDPGDSVEEAPVPLVVPADGGAAVEPAAQDAFGDGVRQVDVIVHGLNEPRVALSVQRFLRTCAGVDGVELREFAEGILRLRLAADASFRTANLGNWDGPKDLSVLNESPRVLELVLA